ncbi:MFS transporter [Aliiruegeria sabulilitoris]|uniref:MFS transporter n=1 Tax=Aliiruegeria sabulilitoris TaxID=1510458 RepID=UPI000836048C|nr:MFS transporter [Aliiruegeria sabulilitoris]NDR57305.1 MFS transporter [Pseudoruegeria sp. M32A2M]
MPSERTSWILVLALWAAGLGAAAQFAKISVPFAFLQQAYPEAGLGLGFLVSLLSFLGILFGLLAGLILPRFGFRRMLIPALALGAVVSLGQSVLPPLPVMLLSRVIEGASHLVIVVAAPTLIARVASSRDRGVAMVLWSTFFGVSFAIVAWLGLPLVRTFGLQSLFLTHAAVMAGIAVLLAWRLPGEPDRVAPPPLGGVRGILRKHTTVYASPHQAAPALAWLFYTLTFVSLLTVLPGQIAEPHRAMAAGAMPIASLVTSMTLGVLLLRWVSAVTLVMTGFALSAGVSLMMAWSPGSPWLAIALFGTLGLVQGAGFASIPELNPGMAEQANANGAVAQMGNLGNTLGTPILLAALGAFGFNGLVGFALTCFAGGFIVHLWMKGRRGRSDWRLG